MSLIPRALFNNDCSLLLPANKSSLISLLEQLPGADDDAVDEMDTGEKEEVVTNISENTPSISEENEVRNCIMMEGESLDPDSWIDFVDYPSADTSKVIIIDAMAIVQTIKKTPSMKTMSDFCNVFV